MKDALRRHRPSHATVVAYVALFVALGGSAYAVDKITSRQIADNTVRSRDVKNGSLMARDFKRGHLAQAADATEAGQVSPAWGAVDAAGRLSRSHNVNSVTRVGEGIYCIGLASGIDPATRGVVATPDFSTDATRFGNSTTDVQAVIEWVSIASLCPRANLRIDTGIRNFSGRIQRANQGFFFSVPGAGGISGIERVQDKSAFNSNSFKDAVAQCPAGKRLIGSGAGASGGTSGSFPNRLTDVVIKTIEPFSTGVFAYAFEEEPTSDQWEVAATAICADVSP